MESIDRGALKTKAKESLKKNFWVTMLVCMCAVVLYGNFNGINTKWGIGGPSTNVVAKSPQVFSGIGAKNSVDFTDEIDGKKLSELLNMEEGEAEQFSKIFDEVSEKFNEAINDEQIVSLIVGILVVAWIIGILVWLFKTVLSFVLGSFVGAPVQVGWRRYFLLNRMDSSRFEDLFSSFKKDTYMNIVKTMFKTNLEIFLWSLLFYFPGLVKSYEYYFVGYIMSENPHIDSARAKQISKEMTDGHKWQIFILEWSFIGWYLVYGIEVVFLSLISCGALAVPSIVLQFPLIGYVKATYAELYVEQREVALQKGIASENELIGWQ